MIGTNTVQNEFFEDIQYCIYHGRSTLYVNSKFYVCNRNQVLLMVEPNQTYFKPNLIMATEKGKGASVSRYRPTLCTMPIILITYETVPMAK